MPDAEENTDEKELLVKSPADQVIPSKILNEAKDQINKVTSKESTKVTQNPLPNSFSKQVTKK